MVWGESSVAGIKAESEKWEGVTHVLGFNEREYLLGLRVLVLTK